MTSDIKAKESSPHAVPVSKNEPVGRTFKEGDRPAKNEK